MTKAKTFWLSFALSVLVFLITCWSIILGCYTCALLESITISALTWGILSKLDQQGKSSTDYAPIVGIGICVGRLLVEVPVHILDFYGTLSACGALLISLITVVLTVVCYNAKQTSTLVLALLVYLLLNLCAHPLWIYGVETGFDHSFRNIVM